MLDQPRHDKVVLTPKWKKMAKSLEQSASSPVRKHRTFNPRITQTIKTQYQFPRSCRERKFNISNLIMKHQREKCKKTGKVFNFANTYGHEYKGIFRVQKNRMTRSNTNFFKNKYLEQRLSQIYKRGGIDRTEEIPTYTIEKHKPMQTFYSKTFRDFSKTFKTPKYLSGMPRMKSQSLRSNAFSKVYIPFYEQVPLRQLYDRDDFETDQYSKMLYVESKMDRLIKRHKQAHIKQGSIKSNLQRFMKNRNEKAAVVKTDDKSDEPSAIRKAYYSKFGSKRKMENKRKQRRLSFYHQKKYKQHWDDRNYLEKLTRSTQALTKKTRIKHKFYVNPYADYHVTPVTMPVEL